MATLAVVVITRNEEDNLGACLDTVAFADELVVVDDNSTDATRQIAERYRARVYRRELDRFGRQKQYAIEQARCDWILVLDADERLTSELADEVREIVQRDDPDCDGFKLRRLTWLDERPVDFSGWYKRSHLRLFRSGKARYVDRRVHEYPVLDDPRRCGKLQADLLHYTYTDEAEYRAKLDRYTTLAAQDWYDAGRRVTLLTAPWFCGVVPVAAWIREFIVQRGFVGGATGLRIAAMSARADRMTARKLRRLTVAGVDERDAT